MRVVRVRVTVLWDSEDGSEGIVRVVRVEMRVLWE